MPSSRTNHLEHVMQMVYSACSCVQCIELNYPIKSSPTFHFPKSYPLTSSSIFIYYLLHNCRWQYIIAK
ncbi:hypothetical protein EUGRSUZ_J00676 [Eucalyptus grandis]|uniref:Uncharacterized protein n=2 Tax=Eucalyptus grandis TaxID=71139 RepID=A0ACC3J372_EUCGR|nr:hypothetical protein EUGRSUZ_J00676 [Eucalyptus grandis]